ncbi:uncharacterized protein LOC142574129 [Dermacentor variabilis]|uniref:uncharacterized protein LOC142574129 n=1 Tax=Dermacentor variabilis TaxID=34621 RepID=UPI003F5BA47C
MEGPPAKAQRARVCARPMANWTRITSAVVEPFLQRGETSPPCGPGGVCHCTGDSKGNGAATVWDRSLYRYALSAPPEQSDTEDGEPVSNLGFYSKLPREGRSGRKDQIQDSTPAARSQANGSPAEGARFSACLENEDGVDWDELVARLDLSFLDE